MKVLMNSCADGELLIPEEVVTINADHSFEMKIANWTPFVQTISVGEKLGFAEPEYDPKWDDFNNKTVNLIDTFHVSEDRDFKLGIEPEKQYLKTEDEIEKIYLAESEKVINESQLDAKGKQRLRKLLREFREVLSVDGEKIGKCKLFEQRIPLKEPGPINIRQYMIPFHQEEKLSNLVKDLEEEGILEPTKSEWNSPCLLVKKPHTEDEWRLVVDYRGVNKIIKVDAYPIPDIHNILFKLGRKQFFSKGDCKWGFYIFVIFKVDRVITAFSPPENKVQFERLPMGMGLSPSAMQRSMDLMLQGTNSFANKYIDDILCHSESEEEHFNHWRQIFTRLYDAGLKLKLKKCAFFQTRMDFLGHTITREGIEMQADKITAIQNYPKPRTVKQVQALLGFFNYYRKFMKNFGSIARPLYDMVKKEVEGKFLDQWGKEQDEAFEQLKQLAVTAPVRIYPDFTKPFILTTDASGIGIGAILSQLDEKGDEHPIAFASRSLKGVELRYPNTDRELLATIYGVRQFHPFLYGRKFTIQTDHIALKLLHEHQRGSKRALTWDLELQEYQYNIVYRAGKNIPHVDALSRYPQDISTADEEAVARTEMDAAYKKIQYPKPTPVPRKPKLLNNELKRDTVMVATVSTIVDLEDMSL
jgi:hypothetical protein